MAVRVIEYRVTADGITPSVWQQGGIQGDHRATKLIFKLSEDLYDAANDTSPNGELYYRFDVYTGAGVKSVTEPKHLDGLAIEYVLENGITADGGDVRIHLVITAILSRADGNDETELELYSFPALLRLRNLPNAQEADGENAESITTLAMSAREAEYGAKAAAQAARESEIKTELAQRSLEEGSEFFFDGGNAAGHVRPELIVDGEISEASENAVMNRVIKAYVDELAEALRVQTEETARRVRQETLLAAHPIGSVYISMSVTSPAELFGGIWERTAEGKAIVGVDEGDADFSIAERELGEKGHVLSVEEMPSHDHRGIYWLGDTENGNISLNAGGANPGYSLKEWASGAVPEAYPTIYTGYNGGGKEHNNIQPSMTFYIWKRTA